MVTGREKKCLFCKTEHKAGLEIMRAFICLNCERKLISLAPDDLRYGNYLRDIKLFWKGLKNGEKAFFSARSRLKGEKG